MFKINQLSKFKYDFSKVLEKNFRTITPINYSKVEKSIFEKYTTMNCIPGMENWLSSYYERDFILETLKELQKIPLNDVEKLKIFHNDLVFTIKHNFRENFFSSKQYRYIFLKLL